MLLLAPAVLPLLASAQIFTGARQSVTAPDALQKVLTEFEVYRLDINSMKHYVQTHPDFTPVQLHLGARHWVLQLEPSNILASDYFVQVASDNGTEQLRRTDHRAYKGFEQSNGGMVRLTMDKQFMHGFVEEGGERYYVEPLWYHIPDADRDLVLLYRMSDVIRDPNVTCIQLAGVEETENLFSPDAHKGKITSTAELSGCYELQIAIAADKSMFNKYGSITGVENHNISVINDVEGDYTGNFNNDLHFVIVIQYIVTGTDPWTSSTNASNLLDSFANWGNAGNFGVPYDNAELWTNRDFDGSTIGIAFLNGICNNSKYHCLQDFSSNSELLRCMTSHELGHNFSAVHDGTSGSCPPNYIMCPFVSTSTTWSSNSQASINNYMTQKINSGCLGPCGSSVPLVADFDWNPDPPCKLQQVQFTDLSTGSITSRTWTFQGGSPASSTATNPIVAWTNAGTYNVTLTLTGSGGPVSTTKQITVLPTPTANFTYSYIDLTYSFTNSATSATSFLWNFGDGNTSTDPNPVYTYAQAGIYNVVLTVENSCGTATKSAVINTPPTAAFSASPTSGCATLAVQMTNQSSSNAGTFVWLFPGGSPAASNQTNPTVVYTTSGTYSVTLTATNGSGSNTTTLTNYITVQKIPTAGFSFAVNNQTVNFTNTSNGGSTYLWDFGDGGTSTQANPSHTYATGGVYTVTLTTTNDCGSTTATHTVSLTTPPLASFNASATSGCGPLTVQFTSTSTGNPTAYFWSFPGGVPDTSTAQSPTVVYNTPGTYGVTLTVSNAAGTNTATQSSYITVNGVPGAGFTNSVNGATATFTNTSSNAASYNWNFGDGNTSTATNPGHTYANDGTYTVTLTAANPCGFSTSTQTITIITPPVASFSAAITSGCAPLTVQFSNTSSANAATFNWSFPGGTPSVSTLPNPVVVYNSAGTYSVTLVAGNAAGSNTSTQTNYINVSTIPAAGFTSAVNGATATFTNTSSNATSYTWNFGDGNTSNLQNPAHVYAGDGSYTVTLTAANACGPNTSTQTLVIVTPPTAGFTANTTAGCGPLTVHFTSTSSANATAYNWSFPGGSPSTSTAQNPTVTYNAAGTYAVTLVVSNAAGSNTATQSSYITVNPIPTAAFTSSTNGAAASFNNTSANAVSYSWNFGDGGASNAANPTHTYAGDGTYTVTLTATNPCGTNTFTQTVVIATPPTAGFTANTTTGCGPLTVQFTSTSSANATSFNWSFPGGSPSTSTAQNPVVTYNAAGTYAVTLVVSNAAGSNTATQSSYITVNPVPTAAFTSSTNGATASFNNTSANAVSYSWNFGDGGASNAANPTHTYASDGAYTVTLTATNPCGTGTFTQTVVIITSPNAGFTAATTSGCGPLTVQFQDLSSGNTTNWLWSFPGGNPSSSTVQNPVVVYNTPGTYTVTLVASTAAGSSTYTQNNFINVFAAPTAGFSSAVAGATVNFTNTSQNATSFLWNFGDNSTSNAVDPAHTYTADGTYTVTLTATNNCGSVTSTQTVTVLLPPQAAFTPSVQSGCIPLEVQFANQSSASATSFAWTFEGGTPATSSAPAPAATWNQPGVYTVTLVAGNAAGTSTATTTITVQAPPTAGFSMQTAGLSVVLTNNSANANSYSWNFGDGNTSTDANPTHTYGATGNYTITLRAENDCGFSLFTQTVEIAGTAPIAAYGVDEKIGCVPFTVQFSDLSAGNPTAWQWSFPGGSPSASMAQNPTVTYSTPGTYAVSLQVTNTYGSNTVSNPDVITVLNLPQAGFTYSANQNTVSFSNTSQFGNSYFWNFGDGNTSNLADPTHVYANTGTYTVELTVSNNCGASTLQQMLTLLTPAGEVSWLGQFRLYPNPNNGHFTIEMSGEAQSELAFILFNTIGQQIKRETLSFSNGALQHRFDYDNLPAGMYNLQIRSGNRVMQAKISVIR